MEDEQSLFFLKFGEKLILSDSKGTIKEEISIDFKIELDEQVTINLYEILISLNTQLDTNEEYLINKINERYIVKIKETNIEYKLDNLLILFFQKMKEKIEPNKEISIQRLILIYEFISYPIRLIIQQAAFINQLNIIHMIDTSKALGYYLDLKNKALKPFKIDKYISIIIIYDNKINISVHKYNPIRKLFSALKEIPDEFQSLNIKNNNNYVILDNSNNDKFVKIKNYVSNLIKNEMGNQNFQNIDKIYIFNSKNFLKELFLGVANSLNYEKTQECTAIFKIIDLKYKNNSKEIGAIIGGYKYNFSELDKNEIHILLDQEIPFEGCLYKTVELIIFDSENSGKALITIYFNQNNYYYISLDMKFCNSMELLFFKFEPNINFIEQYYKNINYEEKFEDKEIFRRINLININREKIELNLISDDYNKIFCSKLDIDYQHLSLVIGDKLNILSYYQQIVSTEKNDDTNLYSSLKIANFLSSKLSLKEIEFHRKDLQQMISSVNFKMSLMRNMKKTYLNIWNNSSILICYGKYIIFESSFIDNGITSLNLNENNHNKFQKIMKKIENFHEKCKKYIKNDDFTISQLFLTACQAFIDYLKYNSYSDSDFDEDLIDLIDFKKKGTIYNEAYENNLELIKNLNKDSFLYPIFLQLNSGFKLMKIQNQYLPTCKISKLTLEQIKLDLIKCLNRYGIRIFFKTKYLSDTNLNSFTTIYNEKNIFNKKLDENELLALNDTNYHKRTTISFLQKHEMFSHLKKTFNNTESDYKDSSRGYLDFFDNKIITLISSRNEDKEKGKFDENLEYFLTNGKIKLIDNLYKCKDNLFNYNKLFDFNLMLEKSNENFINHLKLIPRNEEEIITTNGNESKSDDGNIKNKNCYVDNNRKSTFVQNIKFESKNDSVKIDDKNDIDDDYIREKNRLINESFFRKYTFEKNTICNYKFDKAENKFVPDNEYP